MFFLIKIGKERVQQYNNTQLINENLENLRIVFLHRSQCLS